jgi:hypothetical protein
MQALILLWPIIGIFCGFASTPKWMLDTDPFGYVLIFVCGAVAGPFGIIWFFTPDAKHKGE